MQTRNRLNDKYTRGGYVEPAPGLHQGLLFSYRPMLPEQVEDMLAGLDKTKPGKAAIYFVAATIARQIADWSEVDDKGEPLPVDSKAIAVFPLDLFRQLRAIVEGRQASDLPPECDREQLTEWVAAKLAEGKGDAPGPEQLKADQKN